MKHAKLLLIINILIINSSCKDDNHQAENKINVNTVTTKDTFTNLNQKNIDTVIVSTINDSVIDLQEKKQKDTELIENNKKNELKVIIDGKIYYKKNKDDKRVKIGSNKYHKTHYYNQKEDYYYDIITGKTVYDYGKHYISKPEK